MTITLLTQLKKIHSFFLSFLGAMAFLITIMFYAQRVSWHDWRDYYYAQELSRDLSLLKQSPFSHPNKLELLENRYKPYPRVLCRLAEIYQRIGAHDRVKKILEPFYEESKTQTKDERIDILLTLEKSLNNLNERIKILDELLNFYPNDIGLLFKKAMILKEEKRWDKMPISEQEILKTAFTASDKSDLWQELFESSEC
jgi:tetratricopeptide (TPR) repeat protein